VVQITFTSSTPPGYNLANGIVTMTTPSSVASYPLNLYITSAWGYSKGKTSLNGLKNSYTINCKAAYSIL